MIFGVSHIQHHKRLTFIHSLHRPQPQMESTWGKPQRVYLHSPVSEYMYLLALKRLTKSVSL